MFLVYNPKKPAKYGIKIMGIADSHNAYLYNAYIYTGRGSDGATLDDREKKFLVPTQAILHLSKPVYGSNRNITCDNWFTSLEVAQELLQHRLTLVGTIKKNKPQIPPEFLPNRTREPQSSLYGFTRDFTLLSYVPKQRRAVILLSSMHHSAFTDVVNKKPEMVSFYNSTKSGIDTLDQKCSVYSANRKTRRWPLAVFYHMVSMTCSNAHVLFNLFGNTKQMSRYDFLKSVALSLSYNYLQQRLLILNLPQELRIIISAVSEESADMKRRIGRRVLAREEREEATEKSDRLEVQKTCRFCHYKLKRKTFYKCLQCQKPICLDHTRKFCNDCAATK